MITPENLDALLEGLVILGTGGGGLPEWGRAMLEHDLEMGRTASIVQPDEVPDDAWVARGLVLSA